MRILNFFIIVFGTSLTYVHCKPAHSTRLLPNDMIRVKKRQEDSSAGYLEQCGIVTFPKAQQGVVNVLAFLDSSWPYSHRQAIMLKMLSDRLQRSGLPDTLFFVVNVDPSFSRTGDPAEDEIEKEAWLGVSPEEIDSFSDIIKTTDSLAMSSTSQIRLIQDNEDLEIWKDLRGSRDQVLVIDRCGKLTYQVIVPWSILHFPYVKAAILSTYKDEPCGPCDVTHNIRDPLKNRDEATPQRGIPSSDTGLNSSAEEYFQNDRNSQVPNMPGSDLRSVLEYSTTDTSESGSTTDYLVSEAIDIIRETTTEFDLFDNPDNYTSINFGAVTGNESTTSESATFITTGHIVEIKPEVTTISTNSAESEVTDFSNTVTSHPNNNDQIANLQLKEKLPVLQKFVTDSTDINNSDATDSKYSVSYYETTEIPYTKDDVTDNDTESSVEKEETTTLIYKNDRQFDTLAENVYVKNEFKDTIAKETAQSNTSRFFKIQEKPTDFYSEYSTQTSVEIEDTTISINSDTIQLDSVAVTSNPDELATSENFMIDASTEESMTLTGPTSVYNDGESNDNKNSEELENRFNDNSEDTSQFFDIPLRIIMHAPHFHVDGDSTRMHEYLVLKTGSSDSHRHLSSYDATRLYRGPQDFQETLEYIKSDEIERKNWPMTKVIYTKDESPGLYGEVADYWKNSGGQDNYDYTKESETSEIEQNTEEPSPDERISMKPSAPKNASFTGKEEIVDGHSALSDESPYAIPERFQANFADQSVTDKQIWSDETLNTEEEERRSKLIAHYSKLLPWIYYVLDK